MGMLSDIAGQTAAPQASVPLQGPTVFETELRDHFRALSPGAPYDWMVIDLLRYRSIEGYDYAYYGITRGMDLRWCLSQMNDPALLLDLHTDFDTQWPNDLHGAITHPRQLREVPFWNRVSPFIPPKIISFSDLRR